MYKQRYREHRAAQRRKCSEQETAKPRTGLRVKCRGGKMDQEAKSQAGKT